MKNIFLLFVLLNSHLPLRPEPAPEFLDPTGTYILKGIVKKNKIISHSGEIRVKLINRKKLAMSFYICKGYPGYEFVSFTDTLSYADNYARYNPASNSGYSLIFCFSHTNAEIQQTYTDLESKNSFGRDIIISTFFEKFSADNPIIQDLSFHGIDH